MYCIYIRTFSFTGVAWKLVSPRYLKSVTSTNAVTKWRSFLVKLGVQNIIAVRQFNDKIPKVSLTQLVKTVNSIDSCLYIIYCILSGVKYESKHK